MGEVVGVSGRTYRRIKEIHATAEGERDDSPEVVKQAQALVKQLDDGDVTPKEAERLLRDSRSPQSFKGRGNEKKQVNAIKHIEVNLGAIATALEAHFTEGFEKTFTPSVAAEWSPRLRSSLTRVNQMLKKLESHAKDS